jgi:hypothetical protein
VQQNWDVEADVVVVRFAAAGVAASVTAHDMGADVVILEKAPEGQERGNTRVAGQGIRKNINIRRSASNSRICRDRGVRINFTTARLMAIPIPGSGSKASSGSARSQFSMKLRAAN